MYELQVVSIKYPPKGIELLIDLVRRLGWKVIVPHIRGHTKHFYIYLWYSCSLKRMFDDARSFCKISLFLDCKRQYKNVVFRRS